MKYVRVYAPDGEPFDCTRDRADFLILEAGWTQSVPHIEQVQDPTTDDVGDTEDDAPEATVLVSDAVETRNFSE